MPLPYSRTYEGFATAIYEQLKEYRFNMAYARGAVGRIQLVEVRVLTSLPCVPSMRLRMPWKREER